MAEGVIVAAELLAEGGKRLRRRLVAHVMIAGYVVERNAVKLAGDPPIFRRLCRVAGLIDQVAADHDEGRPEAIGVRDRKFEVRRFLRKVTIVCVHSELRIGHLQEEEPLSAQESGG